MKNSIEILVPLIIGIGFVVIVLKKLTEKVGTDEVTSGDDQDSHGRALSVGSMHGHLDTTVINPANGLPMVGGFGGVDVQGNTFGSSDT